MGVASTQRKMRRNKSGSSNKPTAANQLSRTVIAIFVKHSTRFASGTIILRIV
jgi:hypothetical protein